MNSELPVDIRIPSDYDSRKNTSEEETGKKTPCCVDNVIEYNEKSVQLYKAIVVAL
ncbi:hypothetical protein NSB04_05175 [Blautia pseudococcoides]|nr:hypothetical protein [Blautia pseudococcoides]